MKTLIVKTSSLGDLFHAIPVVHRVKQELGSEIHWLVNEPYVPLVNCFDPVDRAIPFARHRLAATLLPLAKKLRAEHYDMVLDMQGLLKSAVLARMARGKRTIGPSFHREGSRLFYDAVAGKRDKNRHAVQELMDFMDALGIASRPAVFPITLPARAAEPLRDPLPRIALLPCSRWPSKNWPTESFMRLATLLKDAGITSLYLLGDAAGQTACTAIEQDLAGTARNLCGKTDLIQTAATIAQMDLLIANDSGPVHMAAALGVPTLVVFGATEPLRTGPYGTGHRVMRTRLDCQPCFSRTCRRRSLDCLLGITPEQVRDAALTMLRDNPRQPVIQH